LLGRAQFIIMTTEDKKILGIDTSADLSSISLGGISKAWLGNQDQSTELLPKIDDLIRGMGLEYSDLDGVAVVSGPGSYTGVRIGVSVANALGLAISLPVRGIDGLWAQAYMVKDEAASVGAIVSLMSAGNNRVYCRRYDKELRALGDFLVGEVADLLNDGDKRGYLVGDVNVEVENYIKSAGYDNFELLTEADGNSRAWVGTEVFDQLEAPVDNVVIPIYLRGPVKE